MKPYIPMITKLEDLKDKILLSNYETDDIENIEWIKNIDIYKNVTNILSYFLIVDIKDFKGLIRCYYEESDPFYNLFPNDMNYFCQILKIIR